MHPRLVIAQQRSITITQPQTSPVVSQAPQQPAVETPRNLVVADYTAAQFCDAVPHAPAPTAPVTSAYGVGTPHPPAPATAVGTPPAAPQPLAPIAPDTEAIYLATLASHASQPSQPSVDIDGGIVSSPHNGFWTAYATQPPGALALAKFSSGHYAEARRAVVPAFVKPSTWDRASELTQICDYETPEFGWQHLAFAHLETWSKGERMWLAALLTSRNLNHQAHVVLGYHMHVALNEAPTLGDTPYETLFAPLSSAAPTPPGAAPISGFRGWLERHSQQAFSRPQQPKPADSPLFVADHWMPAGAQIVPGPCLGLLPLGPGVYDSVDALETNTGG